MSVWELHNERSDRSLFLFCLELCQLQNKDTEIDLFLCLCGNCTMKDLTKVCFCSVSVCQLQNEESETD